MTKKGTFFQEICRFFSPFFTPNFQSIIYRPEPFYITTIRTEMAASDNILQMPSVPLNQWQQNGQHSTNRSAHKSILSFVCLSYAELLLQPFDGAFGDICQFSHLPYWIACFQEF